tara:strand:+ start:3736 stop:4092 length:357 start_codon:yes stop_codon:yes gene_type:complete
MSNNKDLMGKIRTHYRETISGELKAIEVPEWDMTMYYKRGTNFAMESKVMELQNTGKTAEALVQVLVNRCLDEEGKRIFNEHNKAELMKGADPKVLLSIVGQINDEDDAVSIEDAEKN